MMLEESRVVENIEESLQLFNAQILHKLGFPLSEKRTLDCIIKKDNDIVFMKISKKACTKHFVFKELKKLTEFLKINAIVIADRINDREVEEGVLHIRDRIGIVQPKTVKDFVKGDKVYIYEFKGMYYVKIDGKKLRELRIRKGYGLHELANAVGVSVKALQKYEEGAIDMSIEKAYRFIEIFNNEFEQVLKEVDIFRDRIVENIDKRREVMNEIRGNLEKIVLVDKLVKQGVEAEFFEYIPSDVILSIGKKKVFISIIDSSMDDTTALSKSYENKHVSQVLNGVAVNIVKDGVPGSIIREVEGYGIVYRYNDIINNIKNFRKEIEGEKTL
ncbi:MAG: helix-turn-helix domain-containing protein [Ignisphaera sp.]|uniref:Putative HTH-type transcriptional regulatory protein ENU31_00105 n=1 Tax=Ignisphaera aggregans TaxID=334771 RepID=A0A7C4D2E7_9CREN